MVVFWYRIRNDRSNSGSRRGSFAIWPAAEDSVPLVIEVDGSARFNPGPAGIGVRVIGTDGQTRKEISRYLGTRTNNQAEYEALLCGLKEATQYPGEEVEIRTDSALVFNQATGRFRVKDVELQQLHARCMNMLSRLPQVRLKLVPRGQNRAADKLAQAASAAASSL